MQLLSYCCVFFKTYLLNMEKILDSPTVKHFPGTHTTQSYSLKTSSHMQGFMIFRGIRDPCERNIAQKASPEKKP